MKTFVVYGALIAFVSAVPTLVEDAEGQQYILTPVASRQRRDTATNWNNTPKGLSGGGGANSHQGGGVVSYKNPNGSGGSVAYGHGNGYGHDVKVTGSVPIWSNGQTTVNAGGSLGKHYGGSFSSSHLEKEFLLDVNRRW